MTRDDESVATRRPGAGVVDADAARPADRGIDDGLAGLQPQRSREERRAVEIAAHSERTRQPSRARSGSPVRRRRRAQEDRRRKSRVPGDDIQAVVHP